MILTVTVSMKFKPISLKKFKKIFSYPFLITHAEKNCLTNWPNGYD